MKIFFVLLLITCSIHAMAQGDSVVHNDTIAAHTLQDVVITAYGQKRSIQEVPAAISIMDAHALDRYGGTTPVSALNATAGVHMEERSPGSYRLNIRGSSLRSPFGVRNVKVYYNDIPITDPGGFTYFSMLGVNNIQQVTVIKGPAGSLYGAGNGGAMLINSMPYNWQPGATVAYSYGSYNQNNATVAVNIGSDKFKNTISYQHLSSTGYRLESAMHKDDIAWDGILQTGTRGVLKVSTLYTDLCYQTPGALTLAEYDKDPRSARPDIGAIPGAVTNKTTVYQKNLLGGITYTYRFNDHWQHTTTAYGLYTQFINPTIRNYSDNTEPHYGVRTTVQYGTALGNSIIDWQAGAEVQQGIFYDKTYDNNLGNKGALQTNDRINNRQLQGFTQLTRKTPRWILEGGISVNNYSVGIARLSNTPAGSYNTNMEQVSPRFAALYKATADLSVYANIARGFSPPTTAELSPSGSAINLALHPEIGWNYEAGVRSHLLSNRLLYDISIFYYRLSNAIVTRKDSLGGDTYINAGATDQSGIEAHIDYAILQNANRTITNWNVWVSYARYNFKYKDFIQETNNYNGNTIPGIAPNTLAAGIDMGFKMGLFIYLTYYYSDRVALNDGNTAYAAPYHLLGGKVGYTFYFEHTSMQLYTGIDNALNQKYSLGNDINAAGGRYYNAAAGANYYIGIKLQYAARH